MYTGGHELCSACQSMCAVGCLAWHVVHIIKAMAVVFGLPALAELVNWCLQAKTFPTAGGFSRSNGGGICDQVNSEYHCEHAQILDFHLSHSM